LTSNGSSIAKAVREQGEGCLQDGVAHWRRLEGSEAHIELYAENRSKVLKGLLRMVFALAHIT
jgi:hypothetical protein